MQGGDVCTKEKKKINRWKGNSNLYVAFWFILMLDENLKGLNRGTKTDASAAVINL